MKRTPLWDLSGYGICSLCGAHCEPPWLWCRQCLQPFILAGKAFEAAALKMPKKRTDYIHRAEVMTAQEARHQREKVPA